MSSVRLFLLCACCLAAGLLAQGNLVLDRGRLPQLPPGRLVRLADVDLDGKLDLLRLRENGIDVLVQDAASGRFLRGASLGLGAGPGTTLHDLVVGRFDPSGDALPDLAVQLSDGSVEWFVNTGSSFQLWNPRPVASATLASGSQLLAGDVDGNGRDDVVVLMAGLRPNLFLSGAGGFRDVTMVAMPAVAAGYSSPRGVLGDFDGDGDLDLVVGNASAAPPMYLANNGNGAFTWVANALPAGNYAIGCMVAASITGTPAPEVLLGLAGTATRPLVTWTFNGTSFTAIPQNLAAAGVRDLAVLPVNGDANPDLVVLQGNGEVGHALGNNAGWFGGRVQPVPPNNVPAGVLSPAPGRVALAAGDLEGDGDVDLVTVGDLFEDQVLLRLPANASWADTEVVGFPIEPTRAEAGVFVERTAGADVDYVAYGVDGVPMLMTNDGSARFQPANAGALLPSLPATTLWRSLCTAAIAGQGRRDLIAFGDWSAGSPQVALLTRTAAGAFVDNSANWTLSGQSIAALAPIQAASGRDHVVVATFAGELELHWNSYGVLAPTPIAAFPTGLGLYTVRKLLVGDVNGDARPDVITLESGAAPRVFVAQTATAYVEVPYAVAAGPAADDGVLTDLDGDGRSDLLLLPTGTAAGLRAWVGNGTGMFTDATLALLPASPLRASDVATLAIDGVPRVVFGNENGPDALWTWNGSSYGNATALPWRGSWRTIGLHVGDLDLDGDQDLAVLRRGAYPTILRDDTMHLAALGPAQAGRTLELRAVTPWSGATWSALLFAAPTPPTPTPYGFLRVGLPAILVSDAVFGVRERRLSLPVPPGMPPAVLPLQLACIDLGWNQLKFGPLENCTILP